jgi:Asp-tRNA(Asn)/Glu-tRNA(Gln) amidotransferase A subunit family amidase
MTPHNTETPEHSQQTVRIPRRRILQSLSALGIGSATFQRSLADEAARSEGITVEQIRNAEWISGITLSDEERESLRRRLQKVRREADILRAIPVGYDALPAFRFDPEQIGGPSRISCPEWLSESVTPSTPSTSPASEELSFATIRALGQRLRSRTLTSVELTRHCLEQLVQHDPKLNCVVTLTEDLALQQAQRADRELAEGMDRGPLHGIPWGAKDLIAVSGYPTTWGAPQFQNQLLKITATVARKLEQAGAVLVAKLSLGALAMGDQWFLGQTKNPWNVEQGSSGSSAGSASAVAAGLIPFAIGSETLGSIISPSRRCGVAGLRPTFGRVSRAGCMALSWTMDKLGPLARTADDCGLVFSKIHGRDELDPTSVDRWFSWPVRLDFQKLRIGKVTNCNMAAPEQAALDILKDLGAAIVEVELPREFHEWTLASMLDVEAACIFQGLTRAGNLDGINAWSDVFRASHFVSAVDFLQAQRIRRQLMVAMSEVFRSVDLYVGGEDLGIANLTGHPCLALPVILSDVKPQTRPLCCTLTAGLHDEATLLAVAAEIECRADVLKHRPQL